MSWDSPFKRWCLQGGGAQPADGGKEEDLPAHILASRAGQLIISAL